jgi:putative salt-induced outer membrane protein
MKSIRNNYHKWMLVSGLSWLWMLGWVLAQTNTVTNGVVDTTSSTNRPAWPFQPAITNSITPFPVEPLQLPVQEAPPRRAEEMTTAFRSVGGGRFSVSRTDRILKLPEKPLQKKNGEWVRTVELGINTASGNSDILRYDGSFSLRREDERNLYWLKVGGRYGKSEGVKDTDGAQGEGKYERSLTERVYASLNGEVLRDRIADLSYRALGNVSLGRHFIWTDRTVLNLEMGPGYVREKKGNMTDGFAAGRVAQYLEKLLNSSVRVWQSAEYVPNLEDTSVYYANAEVGLETLLVLNTSLKFVVQDRYDSSPAEGKKRNDLTTLTCLNWTF